MKEILDDDYESLEDKYDAYYNKSKRIKFDLMDEKGNKKEFKNEKKISNRGWLFNIGEAYEKWEEHGFPGETGHLWMEVLETPGNTLVQKMYADNGRILTYYCTIDADSYRNSFVSIPNWIHRGYSMLEQIAQSKDIGKTCENALKRYYRRRLETLKRYGCDKNETTKP